MDYSAQEVLQYVAEDDVKFIRLAFCDVFGRQKNVANCALPIAFSSANISPMPLRSHSKFTLKAWAIRNRYCGDRPFSLFNARLKFDGRIPHLSANFTCERPTLSIWFSLSNFSSCNHLVSKFKVFHRN